MGPKWLDLYLIEKSSGLYYSFCCTICMISHWDNGEINRQRRRTKWNNLSRGEERRDKTVLGVSGWLWTDKEKELEKERLIQ
jgi:hypothetical protein